MIISLSLGLIFGLLAWSVKYYEGYSNSEMLVASALASLIGVLIGGATVAASSAMEAIDKKSQFPGNPYLRFVWLFISLTIVLISGIYYKDIAFGAGVSLPFIILGFIMSPIAWGLSKGFFKRKWVWFDWLNGGAIMAVSLYVIKGLTDRYWYL